MCIGLEGVLEDLYLNLAIPLKRPLELSYTFEKSLHTRRICGMWHALPANHCEMSTAIPFNRHLEDEFFGFALNRLDRRSLA